MPNRGFTAAYPMRTGRAPGMAPGIVPYGERRFHTSVYRTAYPAAAAPRRRHVVALRKRAERSSEAATESQMGWYRGVTLRP